MIQKTRNCLINWLIKERKYPTFPLSDFGRLQHELKLGDIILIEGSSRVSRVIRNLTHSPWTHAVLYIGRMHDIEDVALRKIVAHHYPGTPNGEHLVIEGMMGQGTIISPLSRYQRSHMRICRPKGISHADAQAVVGYAVKVLGTPYRTRQVLDLARFLLPWSVLPRRWISSLFTNDPEARGEVCSSLLAKAFISVKFPILPVVSRDEKTGKINLQPRNSRLFTPSDFDYSPYFEIIKYPLFDMENGTNYRNLPWTMPR